MASSTEHADDGAAEAVDGLGLTNFLEALLQRERLIVFLGLALIAGVGWMYLVDMAASMGGMADGIGGGMGEMTTLKPWTAGYAAMMFVMWAVMMVAMMVPTAVPMVLLYALVWRKRVADGTGFAAIGAFTFGYVIVWTVFSAAATVLQWGMEHAALLSPMMVTASPVVGGLIVAAAGVYQLTPYKYACLKRCRSPIMFLTASWRDGTGGALRMGLSHGAFCVGCCWALMALLFVGGVMNLVWIAAITAFVLLEKVVPGGHRVSWVSGGGMVLFGAGMAVTAL